MNSLSGGWLYLVDDGGRTHARRDCRELGDATAAALEPMLIPYGTRPPSDWTPCEVCGGARPVGSEAA